MSTFDSNIMDWDAVLETDGQQFITLTEGDYNFTVTSFERGRYPGSAKIPPCNKAVLTLTVHLPDGQTATCREDLILYATLEWKLSSFFRCIGLKKAGERVVMDWNKVVGASGRAHFKPRTYTSNGQERTTNSVDSYYDYDPKYHENWVQEASTAVYNGSAQQMAVPQQATAPQQVATPQQMVMPQRNSWNGGF